MLDKFCVQAIMLKYADWYDVVYKDEIIGSVLEKIRSPSQILQLMHIYGKLLILEDAFLEQEAV